MERRIEGLSLYMFEGCPYCRRVTDAMASLGIDVERRDVHADATHMTELIAARGRKTVPVLRIVEEDGSERWLPESADIVKYLAGRFGDGTVPRRTVGQVLIDPRSWIVVGVVAALASVWMGR